MRRVIIEETVWVNRYPNRTTVHKTPESAHANISPNRIEGPIIATLTYEIKEENEKSSNARSNS